MRGVPWGKEGRYTVWKGGRQAAKKLMKVNMNRVGGRRKGERT
jgi:hypothetical protein